jgi:hypothetical protein
MSLHTTKENTYILHYIHMFNEKRLDGLYTT